MLHRNKYQRISLLLCAIIFTTSLAQAQGKLPNVMVLATGGTIAGTGATSTTTVGYTAATVAVERLIAAVPELKNVANVKGEQVFQIASENINNDYWLKLAKRVNTLLAQKDVDGIVVTHGTDTIEETAYFLNLVVKSRKPVVIVGAMRPSTALSADGPINLYNAVLLAGSQEAVGKGVLVALNDQINAAREVTKTNTSTLDTFKTPELGLLGYMQDKGIIYAGVGDGSLADPVKSALVEARKKGVIIVRSSRVGQGIVARNGEANDDELDFVVSDTLNPQKARILLMLALTKTMNTKDIQRFFYAY